jgi:hypothetical protein
MNHPTREEWMSYLYDESAAPERAALAGHLRQCPECASKLNDWQISMQGLNGWRLPVKRSRRAPARPVLQWAAAAAIALLAGFGLGRLTAGSADAAKVRAAIEPQLRESLRQEFVRLLRTELDRAASATLAASGDQTREHLAILTRAVEAGRADDARRVRAALERLESQHATDFLLLKKDLDTVAVNTDAGLRLTEQQLIQFANYSRPANSADPNP